MKTYTHYGDVETAELDSHTREELKIRQTKKHWIDEKGRKFNKKRPLCGNHHLLLNTIKEIT